jgi:hypothetical protein
LCEERSRHCLQRIINHIIDGSLLPGGVPLGAKGMDLSQLPGFKDASGKPGKNPPARRIGRRRSVSQSRARSRASTTPTAKSGVSGGTKRTITRLPGGNAAAN